MPLLCMRLLLLACSPGAAAVVGVSTVVAAAAFTVAAAADGDLWCRKKLERSILQKNQLKFAIKSKSDSRRSQGLVSAEAGLGYVWGCSVTAAPAGFFSNTK